MACLSSNSKSQVEIVIVANDTAHALVCEYSGVNLTGYSIALHIGYKDPRPLVKPAQMDDPINGIFSFQWAHGDLRKGRWCAEIQVTDPAGRVHTFDGLILNIHRQIA